MKKQIKLLASIIISILAVGCSEELNPRSSHDNKTVEQRSFDEILTIAENAPKIFSEHNETRDYHFNLKQVDASSLKALYNVTSTTRSTDCGDIIYAINYKNNDGYVLISSNPTFPGIVAYVEEGSYDLAELTDNNTDIGYVVELASQYVTESTPILDKIKGSDTITFRVNPLLPVVWGQSGPEGAYCPNGISGCANTAMAQLCAYYEYPETLQLTYSNRDKDIEIINWKDIKKHSVRHNMPGLPSKVFCMASEEAHNVIGRLCRQLGELNSSEYREHSTGTSSNMVLNTAQQLGFELNTWGWQKYNDTCMLNPLNKCHPIFIIGQRSDNAGHMWIVDGYLDMRINSTIYLVDGVKKDVTERVLYNHVNWGWDGRGNGYILSSIFDTSRMYKKDLSIHGDVNGSQNFSKNLHYLEISRKLDNKLIIK